MNQLTRKAGISATLLQISFVKIVLQSEQIAQKHDKEFSFSLVDTLPTRDKR